MAVRMVVKRGTESLSPYLGAYELIFELSLSVIVLSYYTFLFYDITYHYLKNKSNVRYCLLNTKFHLDFRK